MNRIIFWRYTTRNGKAPFAIALDVGPLVALNEDARKWLERNSTRHTSGVPGIFEWPDEEDFAYEVIEFPIALLAEHISFFGKHSERAGYATLQSGGCEIKITSTGEGAGTWKEPDFNEWSKK